MAWANYDKSASRRDVIARLMQHVRLPLLSQDFLVQRVEQEPLIKNNSACKDFLIEALKYHLLRPEQKIHFASPRTKQRSPAGLPKVQLLSITVTIYSNYLVMCLSLCISGQRLANKMTFDLSDVLQTPDRSYW